MKNLFLAILALTLGACGGGGGGGAFGPLLSPAQQANIATASSAGLTSTQSQTANASISSAVTNLSNLISSNFVLSSNSSVAASALAAQAAVGLAAAAQSTAAAAAADLSIASNVSIVGVMSAGRAICAAANSCTAAEISRLSYRAAETAKNAAEASLYAITATNQLKQVMIAVVPSLNVSTATAAITTAQTSAASAQATANQVISSHTNAAQNIGLTVPTISPSVGTTGSIAGTPTYSGNTQTIVTTFGNGQTSTATNTATGTAVTWASDNVTRTTTYTFANGGTNAVVATVPGTAGTPTYSGNTQTIVTTFGNGQTSTATNTATGTAVTWASDNVTRTTTYTFANGGTNAVVATVPGTAGTPTYSGNTQTIVTTFGNGQTSTATNTATGTAVTWASDNVTRTTTYTFANGGTHAVVDTVAALVSTPSLTAAVYPNDWTTSGTVLKPSVSPRTNTFGNGVVTTLENGSLLLPFNQSTLSQLSITDPNAVVRSSTTDYDLRWGTPDKFGPSLANLFPNTQSALAAPLSYMGRNLTSISSASLGPTLTQPASDILSAWNQGWTGSGRNVLIVDNFALSSNHGINTMMITNLTAPGASLFALQFDSINGAPSGTAKTINNANLSSSRSINVVNASFGSNWIGGGYTSTYGQAPSLESYLLAYTLNQSNISAWTNFFSGSSSVTNLNNVSSAVIVKSAGNDGLITGFDLYADSYASNASIRPRLLLVGALDKDGTVNDKATIATYSNIAGTNATIADRFVVANGNTPYLNNSLKIDGNLVGWGAGTSFAAPRVAGYAAIVMHKFPNLDAAKTSSIILDTARYDTLTCHPNCNQSIYGKGEASLSRALAPVGRLR
jgi:hypothetical protein